MENLKVSVKKLTKICDMLKQTGQTEASFEYVVGSCFPKVMDNIKKYVHQQYTLGYVKGLEEAKASLSSEEETEYRVIKLKEGDSNHET